MPKRTRRLDQTGPIYKIEWRDETLMTWRPIQRTYPSAEQAERAIRVLDDGRQYRVLEVTTHGYRPMTLPCDAPRG